MDVALVLSLVARVPIRGDAKETEGEAKQRQSRAWSLDKSSWERGLPEVLTGTTTGRPRPIGETQQ